MSLPCAIASFQSNGVEIIVQLSMQTFQQMPRGIVLAMESLVAIIDEVKESDRVRVQSLDLELQVKQQLPGVAVAKPPVDHERIAHFHSIHSSQQ